MLKNFRTFGASPASKALLLLLVASFAAWGIGDYISPSTGAQAMRINGEDISPRQLEQTYNQRLQNLTQILGQRPSPEQLEQIQLAEQVVAEVAARTVLRQAAESLGFQPATQQLQSEIANISAFKNESGQFDVARYRQILAQIGRTPAQFESDLAQDLIVRNLAQLSKLTTPSPSLVAGILGAENVRLTLEVATLTPALASNIPTPTEAQLTAFHQQNQQQYSTPETRSFTVLRISRDDLIASITVPEADIRAAYEANKQHYKVPETRSVRHILFTSREEAEAAAPTITSQQSFMEAANTLSQDPGNQGTKGGSLGTIKADDVVPAFRKAAFGLAVGTLSAPVQTPYGWHLIWVDAISPAQTLAYDDIRSAIAKDLQAEQADEALLRLSGVVDEKVAAGEPLTTIATSIGIKPVTYSTVRKTDEAVEPQELATAFNQNENEVSLPLTMADGGAAYVQVTRINPSSVQSLAQVRPQVVAQWRAAQARMALRGMADSLLTAARNPGTSLQAAAQQAGVAGLSTQTLTVTNPTEAPDWLQRNLMEIYPLPIGATLAGALPQAENLNLVRLISRESLPLDPSTLPAQAKIYQQRLQGDVEALLMGSLTQQAKIELNQPMLKQMFGREVQWNASSN